MRYVAKNFHVYNDTREYYYHKNVIQKQCQQTLNAEELCSITTCKDNYSLSENTFSQTNIISQGFFQTAVQKTLQNSEIEKAFEIVEQYIETTKRKFYRFLDTETKKIIISKQLNRF